MRTLKWILGGIFVFVFLIFCLLFFMDTIQAGIMHLGHLGREIREIRIRGTYQPEDPQRLDSFKEIVIKQGRLKPGEVFEEIYEHLVDILDEKFENDRFNYCYENTPDGKKEPVFNKNLRVRLYDVNENVIAEDYLRVRRFRERENNYDTVSYLPYEKKGHFFRVVRLDGEKEVLLWKPRTKRVRFLSKAQLIRSSVSRSFPYNSPRFDSRYPYLPETKCFHDNPFLG